MRFNATLDSLSIAISVAVLVLFALIAALMFYPPTSPGEAKAVIILLMLLTVYASAYLFSPLAYEITADAVVIHRPIRNVLIPLHTITSVEPAGRDRLKNAIRTFGVGGLFGYYGKFLNRAIGNMTWYATRRDQGVLLTTRDNQKILLTPDDPDRFIRMLGRPKGK